MEKRTYRDKDNSSDEKNSKREKKKKETVGLQIELLGKIGLLLIVRSATSMKHPTTSPTWYL